MFETTDIQEGKFTIGSPFVASIKVKVMGMPQSGVYDIARGIMTGAVSTSKLCKTVAGSGVDHAMELTWHVIVTVIVSVTGVTKG